MAEESAKIVDEYSIAVGPDAKFPTVWLTLKLSDGSIEGPFEFVPAFAHKLADEMCIASARTAKTVSNHETRTIPDGGSDAPQG